MTSAQELQRARWYQDGRCTGCGWLLAADELAQGFELCGECDTAPQGSEWIGNASGSLEHREGAAGAWDF
jgi:hypothetical protein